MRSGKVYLGSFLVLLYLCSNRGGFEKVLANKQTDEVFKGLEQRLLPLTKPAVVQKAVDAMKKVS